MCYYFCAVTEIDITGTDQLQQCRIKLMPYVQLDAGYNVGIGSAIAAFAWSVLETWLVLLRL